MRRVGAFSETFDCAMREKKTHNNRATWTATRDSVRLLLEYYAAAKNIALDFGGEFVSVDQLNQGTAGRCQKGGLGAASPLAMAFQL